MKSFPEMINQESPNQDFPGGPVAKTLRFPCNGPRFHPWSLMPHLRPGATERSEESPDQL